MGGRGAGGGGKGGGGGGGGGTKAVPAGSVRVDGEDTYRYNTGKAPRGKGSWAFDIGGKTTWAPANMLFTNAKQWAKKQAGLKGLTSVKLLP